MDPVVGDGSDIFRCAGEMAERCAAFDWSTTSLGPVETWSQSLRTTTSMLLRTRFPMCLSWGKDLVLLYNDAFVPTLGAKHPTALGAEIADVFAEIWDEVGYLQWSVLDGGDATFAEDLPLVLERGLGPEETFYTYSYSHVPDDPDDGAGPGGVLAVVNDTTRAVVGARRMALLNELAATASDVAGVTEAVEAGLAVLGEADHDLDHGACYLPADGGLELVASFGPGPAWPAYVATGADHLLLALPDPGRRRVTLPLRHGSGAPGVLVLAPHELRPRDDEHDRFLHLVADQVQQLLTIASTRADEHHRLASLAAADKAKSTFLSNVSHEFRTPLTLLLGPLEDAVGGGAATLDDDDVAAMHQSAHRLLRMVNGLLEVTRYDAERRPAVREPTDVARLSQDLLRPFLSAAARARLELRTDLDPAVGTVEVDPRLWETIVLNLTANAIKYTARGRVSVGLARQGDELTLRVSDTGIGIEPGDQDRIFHRFHRVTGPVGSPGRTVEGTGLGLTLVADAVRAHEGTVEVESVVGEGSTFVVRLPVRVAPSPVPLTPTDTRAAAALADHVTAYDDAPTAGVAEHTETGPVIVVVDDNAGMLQLLSRVLAPLRPVVTCRDGIEALEVLRRQAVDLVVTDVMMPRLDGVGLVREIRTDDALARTPVVLLSARAGPDAATEALAAGADDYVVKPFTHDELLARCRTSMELASLRAELAAEAARLTMLAGVSHDMQTPLSVISAVLELLANDGLDLGQRRDLVARASSRATQLEHLIGQFVDWSRLAGGTDIATHPEPVDLGGLLEEVAALHDGTRLDASATSPPLVVTCDRARTERILHNLLDNAHSAAHSVVDVEVRVGEAGPEVHVVDDGAGVDPLVLPRLFEAFGPTAKTSGSGLGLYVSREAARAQGGDLVLAATGDDGCRFVLRLPAAP